MAAHASICDYPCGLISDPFAPNGTHEYYFGVQCFLMARRFILRATLVELASGDRNGRTPSGKRGRLRTQGAQEWIVQRVERSF